MLDVDEIVIVHISSEVVTVGVMRHERTERGRQEERSYLNCKSMQSLPTRAIPVILEVLYGPNMTSHWQYESPFLRSQPHAARVTRVTFRPRA
jgi:hypothetical protein